MYSAANIVVNIEHAARLRDKIKHNRHNDSNAPEVEEALPLEGAGFHRQGSLLEPVQPDTSVNLSVHNHT